MNNCTTTQAVLFPDLVAKPVVVAFDRLHATSDGGAVLLKAADGRVGVSERLAACLVDNREPEKVTHTLRDLPAQRMFYRLWISGRERRRPARRRSDPEAAPRP